MNPTMREGPNTFLYNEKAPYEPSGKGELGCVRWDPKKDLLMCHECGEWFANLGTHARRHDLTAREYKKKHGLPQLTALIADRLRMIIGKHGASPQNLLRLRAPETIAKCVANARKVRKKHCTVALNTRGRCRAQILEKLKDLASRLGRTPSIREVIRETGISQGLLQARFGSIRLAMRAAKLEPRKYRGNKGFHQRYSDHQLIYLLALFMRVQGRRVVISDCRRGLIPCFQTYFRRFGSWKGPVEQAVRMNQPRIVRRPAA